MHPDLIESIQVEESRDYITESYSALDPINEMTDGMGHLTDSQLAHALGGQLPLLPPYNMESGFVKVCHKCDEIPF